MKNVLITGGSDGIGLAVAYDRFTDLPLEDQLRMMRLIRLHRLVSRKTAINIMGRSSPLES